MLISICIPHFNRSRYLLAVLDSIKDQDYSDAEVVISDDCSTDDSQITIPPYVAKLNAASQIQFRYFRQQKNLGYDGNLRAALRAGRGEYLLILGNDDCLSNNHSLSSLADSLTRLNCPDICFANFYEYGSPKNVVRRATATTDLGSGPEVAVRSFRSFSFVGGTIFKRTAFEEHDTCKHDGSIYVQMFLAARIVAGGGRLGAIDEAIVAKDVQIAGQHANSYVDQLAANNRRVKPQTGGLDKVGEVACDAILPYVSESSRQRFIATIYGQLLLFSYSYWLYNYRKVSVYRAALNLAYGCFPTNLVRISGVAMHVYAYLILLFVGTTLIGLVTPLSLLSYSSVFMARLSRRIRVVHLQKIGAVKATTTA